MKLQSVIAHSASLIAIGASGALIVFGSGDSWGQERCKISWETPAANTKYTEQHELEVGDVSGHQIRVFELHRTFPDDQPNCEGLKRVEQWSRGYSDYIDRNGRAWGYSVTLLENGDKIFGEWSGISQTVVNPDGSKKSSYTGVVNWTGGTGRYEGVRGLQRDSIAFDPETNFNEARSEAEYWFEK